MTVGGQFFICDPHDVCTDGRKSETLMVALNAFRISIRGPIGTILRSWEMFSMFSMFSWEKQIWGKAGIRAVTAATWAPTTITR